MTEEKNITEILHHMGELDQPFGAVAPPLFQTSIFRFENFDAMHDAFDDEANHYIYSRGNNPTVNLCEEKIAALEHAERAKLVGSGIAAATLAIQTFVKGGSHVVCVRDCYDWVQKFFDSYLPRFGVEVTYVEGTSIGEFEAAIRPNTTLIYLESPCTFTFLLQPLKQVAELARSRGIPTVIDNSWATPMYQNPLDLGIDVVIHSASKYLGGNSDLVAGVICGSNEIIERIFTQEFQQHGPVPDPFMAWLILRNLRTLHVRMPVHYRNAMGLCQFLESRDDVETVCYPMLPSFPQYELAKEQMKGGSGLFSFRLKTRDREKVRKFVDSLHLFKIAVSWGGYESLISPSLAKAGMDGPIADDRISLIRLHAGLEDLDELIADVKQALDAIK